LLDLETSYLGLPLKNPLVAAASPLTGSLTGVCRLARAGVSAVVLESLFEEQINPGSKPLERVLQGSADRYFGTKKREKPTEYLRLIESCCASVDIPIIASLNGVTPGGWLEYSQQFEEAGASAVELNLYRLITDVATSGDQAEQQYVEVVRQLTSQLSIPVAVKISPFFSALPNLAQQFAQAGARGLVLFNRFYQPDFDLEAMEVLPRLELSRPQDLLLPLTWTAILHGRVELDLAITSGVHGAAETLKAMMAGARVVQVASRFLRDGAEAASTILNDLSTWMEERDYLSLGPIQGSMSQINVADPAAFERANYRKTLRSFNT